MIKEWLMVNRPAAQNQIQHQTARLKRVLRRRKPLPPPSLASVLRRRLDIARAEILRCGPSPDDEMIHDLRVSIRRAGEVIRVMQQAELMGREKAQRIMRIFRKVRRFAGDIRDMDIERDYLAQAKNPPMGPIAAQVILRTIANQRQKLAKKLHLMLSRAHGEKTFMPLMRTLENARAEADEAVLKKELFRRIKKNANRLVYACDSALGEQTPQSIHQTRIAGKRLRYAFELAHEARLTDCREQIAELKRFQKTAGNLHDVEFIFENLSEYAFSGNADRASPTKRTEQQRTPAVLWSDKIHGRIKRFQDESLAELKRIRSVYGNTKTFFKSNRKETK
jgi:CHAD domain-containing protein